MELDLIRIKCGKNIRNKFFLDCIKNVFRLRYDIYCKEMRVIEENDEGMLYDAFDFSTNTIIFLASVKSKVIGTIRLVKYCKDSGFPLLIEHKGILQRLNKIINLERKIYGGRVFTEASRFAMLKDYRRSNSSDGKLVSFMLMLDYINFCKDSGITDIIGISNPNILNFYKKIGFKPLFSVTERLTGIESPVIHGEVDTVGRFIKNLYVKIKFLGIFNRYRRFIINWIK